MTGQKPWQSTLAQAAEVEGVGLHTGLPCVLRFCPAPPDSGYAFVRTDLPEHPVIPADPFHVTQTQRGTTLSQHGAEVQTVEHVLAALAGLQIDNCTIEMSSGEPPIMDGSCLAFVAALQAAGRAEQPGHERRRIRITETMTCEQPGKDITAWPHAGLRIGFYLEFAGTWVPPQRVTLDLTPEVFVSIIAPARTFCFEKEIDWLKRQGLAQGGSRDNAVILGEAGVLNGPLRDEQELVRHKILDLIGDLALLNGAVEGCIVATRSGHALNNQFARQLQRQHQRTVSSQRGNTHVIINSQEIQELLPHRYPFLLVDRIIDLEEGKRVVGIKNVTINEHFFQGHFPGHPIMPGVLIVEAMAQTGGVLLLKQVPDAKDKVVYFVKLDNVKFRKPVVPGDQLRFVVTVVKLKEKLAQMHGDAYVGEDLVCEADLMSTIVDR